LERNEPAYALGAVVRLTGLSDHVIRAWERRYGAVRPRRSPGGTRLFSERDVARLRLLRAATEVGHRISDLAPLGDDAIERLLSAAAPSPSSRPLDAILTAIDGLDAGELERLLAVQFAALGPTAFARAVAGPLLREVGDRWEHRRTSIASEHMLSALVRGLLGAALRPPARRDGKPRLLFATPEGERHELGLLSAAIGALEAGADVTYLGPDLPAEDLAQAARRIAPEAVALSVVNLPSGPVRRYLGELRRQLPASIAIWAGGPAAVDGVEGVELVRDLDELERRISLLRRLPEPGAS
jgi:DNA-binding transcriptional MerR regulator